MKKLRCLPLGRLTATVVARGGGHVGVTRKALYRGNVRASVEQVGHERPSQIVRREGADARLCSATTERVEDGLVRHAAYGDTASLVDGDEERTGLFAAHRKPRLHLL